MTAGGHNDQRALIPYGPKSKTGSPSPDGGSAAPILRGFAFFVARGCVDQLELILCHDVLALVGNHVDHRPSGPLPALFLRTFTRFPRAPPLFPWFAICLSEKNSYLPGSTKSPPMSGFEISDAHAAYSAEKISATNGRIRMGWGIGPLVSSKMGTCPN